jgi:hypothetical protein
MLAHSILLPFLGLLSLSSAAPITTVEARAALSSEVIDTTAESQLDVLVRRGTPKKRGLAYNDPALTKLFDGTNSKISWMWNWDSARYSGASGSLVYCPILHNDQAGQTSKWFANFQAAWDSGSRHVFSFNEPDQCGGGGACMQDVGQAVAAHKKWIQPLAAKYGNDLKIGAPSVTNGVRDANTGSDMGLPWLKKFLAQCTGCKIDYIVVHWYDSATNIAYFKQHLQDAYAAGGNRPVYVTEFAPASGSPAEKEAFLRQVLPWMDSQPWIVWYSYFMTAKGNLVNDAGNGLTTLGEIYNTV